VTNPEKREPWESDDLSLEEMREDLERAGYGDLIESLMADPFLHAVQ
jgi:hypothetical protein